MASVQMGGRAAGSAPRHRYYDPGARPAPRRIEGAHWSPIPKESERQLRKRLMAERGITTGRQWRKLLKQLRREDRLAKDAQRARALVAAVPGLTLGAP